MKYLLLLLPHSMLIPLLLRLRALYNLSVSNVVETSQALHMARTDSQEVEAALRPLSQSWCVGRIYLGTAFLRVLHSPPRQRPLTSQDDQRAEYSARYCHFSAAGHGVYFTGTNSSMNSNPPCHCIPHKTPRRPGTTGAGEPPCSANFSKRCLANAIFHDAWSYRPWILGQRVVYRDI